MLHIDRETNDIYDDEAPALPGLRSWLCAALWVAGVVAMLLLMGCSGAKKTLRENGGTVQNSGLGLSVRPFDPTGPRLDLGAIASTLTIFPPSGTPSLSRVSARGPLNTELTSTVGSGSLGEQLAAAGPTFPATIQALHPNNDRPLVPFQLPDRPPPGSGLEPGGGLKTPVPKPRLEEPR